MEINWPNFKSVLEQKDLNLQSVVVGDNIWLVAMDGFYKVECLIPNDVTHADYIDYQASHAANANKLLQTKVVTEFEMSNKMLRLSSAEGTFDLAGDAVLEVKIPGTFSLTNPARLLAEAYVYEDVFGWGDRMTKVEIVDKDNLLGFGSTFVLETLHDPDVPEENRGWRFYPSHQNSGEMEIEPLGGFGELPGGMWLRGTFKRAPGNTATKIIVDIWWGNKT